MDSLPSIINIRDYVKNNGCFDNFSGVSYEPDMEIWNVGFQAASSMSISDSTQNLSEYQVIYPKTLLLYRYNRLEVCSTGI